MITHKGRRSFEKVPNFSQASFVKTSEPLGSPRLGRMAGAFLKGQGKGGLKVLIEERPKIIKGKSKYATIP